MGRAFGFIVLVIVVAIGGYLYMKQTQSVTSVGSNPETTIAVTAVRNDLLAIANAERDRRMFAADPLVQENKRLIPSVTRVFRKDQDMYVYLEAYQPAAETLT